MVWGVLRRWHHSSYQNGKWLTTGEPVHSDPHKLRDEMDAMLPRAEEHQSPRHSLLPGSFKRLPFFSVDAKAQLKGTEFILESNMSHHVL